MAEIQALQGLEVGPERKFDLSGTPFWNTEDRFAYLVAIDNDESSTYNEVDDDVAIFLSLNNAREYAAMVAAMGKPVIIYALYREKLSVLNEAVAAYEADQAALAAEAEAE